jgi:gamma-glutamyl-gamma-aminobutyrate hydrolase PuuD
MFMVKPATASKGKQLVPLSVEEINKGELIKRRVTVIEENMKGLPELWLNVFVFGPEAGPSFNKMFARCKCFKSDTPDDADLVVFSGSGHDIDPALYGQKPHKSTFTSKHLDDANIKLYQFCKKRGIPMFGVCGGAQLLAVMNGASLFQDVDNHNSSHTLWVSNEKTFIQKASSVHHQMVDECEGMEILATAHVSKNRWRNSLERDVGTHSDIEAFWFRETACLGVQGHPEYSGYTQYTIWCMKQLDHYLNENADLCYRANDVGTNKLRINPELLAEREAKAKSIINTPVKDMIIVEAKG